MSEIEITYVRDIPDADVADYERFEAATSEAVSNACPEVAVKVEAGDVPAIAADGVALAPGDPTYERVGHILVAVAQSWHATL